MPRPLRIYSNSKIYHIILKGIDNQEMFYDDQDRQVFLKHLLVTKKEFYYQIYAYCLMDNHVHIVIKTENEFLSKAMQSLSIRYAHYFNRKYQRVGPLLQNRFRSKAVEDKRYFMEVCRYIHQNPENAGMAKTENYKWSSYKEYIGKEKIIDKSILLHYLNDDIKEFIKYTTDCEKNDINNFAEFELIERLTDEELTNIIMKKFNIDQYEKIIVFFKEKTKDELKVTIKQLKNIQGTNVTQLARITRIGRRYLEKIWKEK